MDNDINKIKLDYISKQLSISFIKEIITKFFSNNNILNTEIDDILKILEKLVYFLQNNLKSKYIFIKINKFLKFINNFKNIVKKEYDDNKNIQKNKIIFTINLYFLIINIKNCNHYKIRKYLKSLLIFYIDGKISINNLILILEIILISIIELLKKDCKKQYQMLDINNEPLLFINDIIETIINFPIMLIKDNIFVEG